MMLYLANWGSKQLAFRFPKAALDVQALQPYVFGVDEIEQTTVGQYIILNIEFNEEEGMGWIDDEGQIASFAPLRDDILRGDLRAVPGLAGCGIAFGRQGRRRRVGRCG